MMYRSAAGPGLTLPGGVDAVASQPKRWQSVVAVGDAGDNGVYE